MKRGLVVAVGGAAIVIAGLSGCTSGGSSSSETTATTAAATTEAETETATATETASATAAAGSPKVVIDGQDQNVQGTVVCASMGGNVNIAIGEAMTGIAAVVSEADPPVVSSVGLGNVNGVTLGYQQGAGQGEATAVKDGNTYKITGTATGIDMANPMQPVNKPFEIEVTCP
ncbi:MAG: lipoprotein LpqH [Actinobacteria bacterium]|nr:lipoprotein LpqH [Actinomycetota bacterium]